MIDLIIWFLLGADVVLLIFALVFIYDKIVSTMKGDNSDE